MPSTRKIGWWRGSSDPQVDLEAKQVRFGELFQSDNLLLPEECEFQKYRILVQKIGRCDQARPETRPTRDGFYGA